MKIERKVVKILAIGYFWLCLAAGSFFITICLIACFNEPQMYLRKVSLDGKFLAQLSGGIYDKKFLWTKLDPKYPSGIYLQKKGSHEKWLVAQQDNPGKYLHPGEIDVQWEPDDSVIIETDENLTILSNELNIDGQIIKISLSHAELK